MTRFILDSGDSNEYRSIAQLFKDHGMELWGGTTNPSLIAKKLAGKKVSSEEAFELQREIVLELTEIVPGSVSAEVFADLNTTAEQMIEQGKEIASWHERVFVKLPTTVEGFKARTGLRREKIPTNNTLVFSQQQIYAICLHEKLIQEEVGSFMNQWPPFISPFVGRLDDIGENVMDLVENGMKIKAAIGANLWMLEASVRKLEHMQRGIDSGSELITAPAKVYEEWLLLPEEQKQHMDVQAYAKALTSVPEWMPTPDIQAIVTIDGFMEAIISNSLDIRHPLTEKGIIRFTEDWNAILS